MLCGLPPLRAPAGAMVARSVGRGGLDPDLFSATIDRLAGASCAAADGFSRAVHASLDRGSRASGAPTDGRTGAFGAAFNGGSGAVRRPVQGLPCAIDGRWGRSRVLRE